MQSALPYYAICRRKFRVALAHCQRSVIWISTGLEGTQSCINRTSTQNEGPRASLRARRRFSAGFRYIPLLCTKIHYARSYVRYVLNKRGSRLHASEDKALFIQDFCATCPPNSETLISPESFPIFRLPPRRRDRSFSPTFKVKQTVYMKYRYDVAKHFRRSSIDAKQSVFRRNLPIPILYEPSSRQNAVAAWTCFFQQ